MIKKIYRCIKQPWRIMYFFVRKNIIRLNDKRHLKLMYRCYFNKKLNLENPITFNEKLQWLKLYDRKEIYKTMVDKYLVKDYVANIIGEKYIIPTFGIYDKFDDIEFDKLPNKFVIKVTHYGGGNGVYLVKDKKNMNKSKIRKEITKLLNKNLFYYGREWPYKDIKPRIIIEQYIEEKNNENLLDYKFMCFNGKVEFIFVCSDRNQSNLKIDFFDTNWNKMPFTRHYPNSNINIPKPQKYNEMIKLAEKLSKDIPFIRVDFYEINCKVYFGELTLYPGCGLEEFTPSEYDEIIGNMIKLPKKEVKDEKK